MLEGRKKKDKDRFGQNCKAECNKIRWGKNCLVVCKLKEGKEENEANADRTFR